MEDLFNISFGYGQWILYGMPFVLIMMPILWLTLNRRFKTKIHDLRPALETLKQDIGRMGGWNRKQIVAIIIFLVMFLGWVTEKNLILHLTGIRLGIGVIAAAGAVAYLLTGIVNWRDYQEKVDWRVVWLYAGAIILGTGSTPWPQESSLLCGGNGFGAPCTRGNRPTPKTAFSILVDFVKKDIFCGFCQQRHCHKYSGWRNWASGNVIINR